MSTSTVRHHRVLRAPPERLYRAFVEPGAFERWLPPFGFIGKVHAMNAVVGGEWRMSFTNFGTGHAHSFGGRYLELVPGQRVVYDAAFDDPNLPGRMTTTVTLARVSCGTDMSVVQDGIPSVIPVEMCYLGWQESLLSLAQLVEPEIPG
ncbi:SRPBCC family protein [Ramlibacter sp. Leaf400]|uniref:SRPBCC family protein n=1 Tax=Ramlibacter sp. Leaf400 TaxID=1736365 RepID=UPI0006FA1422|nr:SRPBCC family protein [Ramlibacter sp. Leaf400]KQT07568.1 polyketide cyclase [Ramlibacter sp. Leaf400]